MEGRFDWGRYDFGTFRRRDVLTMGRFDCKALCLFWEAGSCCAFLGGHSSPPPLLKGELGSHLAQCGLGRGLPLCQVVS